MGYDTAEYRITARISNHNSSKDDRDRALWDGLMERIESILDEPQYQRMSLVYGGDTYKDYDMYTPEIRR